MRKKSQYFLILAILSGVLVSGCAHVKPTSSVDEPRSPRTVSEVIQQNPGHESPAASSAADKIPLIQTNASGTEISVGGVKLKNTKFDIPITINSRVEYWVDYFCGKGRGYFTKYLERSEFFIPYITPILKENGLPEDLVYLAMIESGFNNFIKSRAKAVGPWQFMSGTGKRYGLMVNWWVDERRDIRKSTMAAVEYLRDLYNIFQSWELAAASYNAGEGKVARAVQRYGSKDFWVIAEHRFLKPETRDYVPKIIAAALITKNRGLFGFPVSDTKPGAGEAVAGDGEVVKVIKTDKPLEDSATISDAIKASESDDDADDDSDSPGIVPATLTIPVDNGLDSNQLVNNSQTPQPLAKPVPTPHMSKSGQVGGEELAEFEVQSPADILKIARAAGLSYQTVKSLNPELLRWVTPPTLSTYRVKLPASVKEKFLTTYNHDAFPRKVQFMTYKIRPGETIVHVARHFGIKVDPLSDLNGLSPRMRLRAGVRVLLPIPNDRSRSLASLDVRDPPEVSHRRRKRLYRVSYKRRESARTQQAHRDST